MTLPKIEEWIKEVEERPASAQAILKLIANRLRDLTERNEELLAENIALQDGTKVEAYTRRIAHLEYQLDLLKRRFGLNPQDLASLATEPATAEYVLLVYDAHGRILKLGPGHETGGLGRLTGEITAAGEPPRLLTLAENEEMLLLFTTGRVSTCPVEMLPSMEIDGEWTLEQGSLPDEPHAGERLACILPLSNLPLVDYFLQASRRGCVKKTMTSMAETIFTNHFLGKGTIERLDQPHDLALCRKQDLYALVTHEGRLLGLEVDALSYSVEERIKLDGTDHVVAGFTYQPGELIFCLTQTGKVITKDAGFVELAKTSASRGQALIPPGRLEQGVRFIGAAPFRAGDRVAVLDNDGNLRLQPGDELISAGSVQTEVALAAFCLLGSHSEKQAQP